MVQTDEERKAKRREKNKIRMREYSARPEVKARAKEYNKRPEVVAKSRKYNARPETKQRRDERRSSPEGKAKLKEYSARPEVKAKHREYQASSKGKAKKKEYSARPEVKAKRREYYKLRDARPEVIAKRRAREANPDVRKRRQAYRDRPEVKAKTSKRNKEKKDKEKMEVYLHYSKIYSNSNIPCCACCGLNSHMEFLSLDHIAGRKEMDSEPELVRLGYTSKFKIHQLLLWITRNDFPEGFQILCLNCNMAKGHSKDNKCPHEKQRLEETFDSMTTQSSFEL